MFQEKIALAINEQINKELYSAYLYLSMAAWLEDQNLPGFANWMRVQSQEELAHAMIFFNYMVERGGRIRLAAIEKPPTDFENIVDIFSKTLAHEEKVTASIHALLDLAILHKDHATQTRLHWFVDEQVEEEANASKLLADAKRIGERGEALLMMDKELATRTFVMPAPLAGGGA